MKNFVFGLAMMFCAGCSTWEQGSPTHRVYISPSFNNDHRKLVVEALLEWQEKVNDSVTFLLLDDWKADSNVIWVSPSTIAALTLNHGDLDSDSEVIGMTKFDLGDGTGNLIELAVDQPNAEFSEASRHELGHALGLSHAEKGTVMYHSYNGSADCITCSDVMQFCGVWDCIPEKMKGCQK